VWIAQRFGAALITLWLAVTIVFCLLRLLPGNAIRVQLAESGASPAIIAQREAALGLDQPVLHQYVAYWADFLRGNLGVSLISGQPVSSIIATQAAPTLSLAATALLFGSTMGVLLGCMAGLRGDISGRFSSSTLILLLSTPAYWLGTLILFAATMLIPLNASLPQGSLLLPALALGLSITGAIGRVVQEKVRETRHAGFVWQARAKGMTEYQITRRHILRVGLLPVISVIALQFAFLASGVVITEMIFARAGLGRTLLDSTLRQDYPVVQGIVAWSALLIIGVMFITEIISMWVDPRVRNP
jgi:ABC-type dipeptide/oligopeptide/nickel transport system permease component